MTVNELFQRTREYNQLYDHYGKMFHGPQHGTPAAVYINQFWIVGSHVLLTTKCHRKGKNRGPTGTGTQSLSLSVRQLGNWAIWPTSEISPPPPPPPCLDIFVPANLLGTTEEQTRHTFLMLVVPAVSPHWATICHICHVLLSLLHVHGKTAMIMSGRSVNLATLFPGQAKNF